jgi:ornithine--oxo-acid transaminase
MPFDIRQKVREASSRAYDMHRANVNPQYMKVLKTIGFDRSYVRGEGAYLWDQAGRQYLDFLSGYGVFALGRNHPEVRRIMKEFIDEDYPNLVHFDASTVAGLLAEELVKRMPNGLDIAYFTNSGTEGVETAIKFAKCSTKRPGIVFAAKAFHGLTTGALALNGDDKFRQGFEPYPSEFRKVPFNDLEALQRELEKGDVAAFIVEPIQGKGVNLPLPGYLVEAAGLCRRHGALFVADEVQCGLYRTGTFLTWPQEGDVDPDIVILSKALSAGYVPVGAVMTRRRIYEKVYDTMERAVVHTSTFGQNALAMVAGLAAIHVMEEEKLGERALRLGALFKQGLDALKSRFEFMREVRQRGLMIGIEFNEPKSFGLKMAWKTIKAMDKNLFCQAIVIPLLEDHGIITQVAGHNVDVVKLLPPLVLEEEDVQRFLVAFEAVMTGVHKFPGPAWDVVMRIGKNAIGSRSRETATT